MPRSCASRKISLLTRSVVVLVVAAPFLLGAPGGPSAEAQPYKYTGAASCGSSKCHGKVKPEPEFPKLNENTLWFQKDQHAKAYATLTNEELKSGVSPSKMAKKLKIAKAETSDRCLSCHAVNVKKELRGPKFDITEGVHCDGCHGPGEKWLEPHAEKGWTHEKSVAVGMYDTKNLLLRAKKCVSCHLAIEPELIAAGHPDLLAFELDSFSADMPPHWRDKGAWFSARAWTTGQVVSLIEAMKQLAGRIKSEASPDLLKQAWEKAWGHAAVLRHALKQVDQAAQKSLGADVAALSKLLGSAGGDLTKAASIAAKIAALMDGLGSKIAKNEFGEAGTVQLIKAIAGDAATISKGYKGAEQATKALDLLYIMYSSAPGKQEAEAVLDALDALFTAIDDPDRYDTKKFNDAMGKFKASFK